MIDSFQMEKQELEQIVKDNGWETLRIVLFDKTNREPFAIYFFKEDGKYVIQSAGERGGFDSNPTYFDNFEEAKEGFKERIEAEIRLAILWVKDDGYYAYPSPLWDQYAIQLETTAIDAIGIVDGHLELLLVDPNHWFIKDEQDHLLKLQEKINNYIHYLESKQYVAQYGDGFDKKVINITFKYSPSDNGLAFLVQVQKALQHTDMSLKVVFPN